MVLGTLLLAASVLIPHPVPPGTKELTPKCEKELLIALNELALRHSMPFTDIRMGAYAGFWCSDDPNIDSHGDVLVIGEDDGRKYFAMLHIHFWQGGKLHGDVSWWHHQKFLPDWWLPFATDVEWHNLWCEVVLTYSAYRDEFVKQRCEIPIQAP